MADDIRAKLKIDGLDEAKKGLKDVGKASQDLADDLDDTRTAGQKIADAVKAGGDEIVASLRADEAAAEALGQALGPELAAKIGQGGLDEAVVKFKKLGLTTEEIKADADALADSIRHLDTISVGDAGLDKLDGSARHAKAGVDDLGKSADSSKSVLANMVGNSAQDVAGLGGVAGTAGVAIGQMGEYIVDALNDGDKLGQTLGNFTKILGPMALLAVATKGVSAAFEIAAKEEKHAADVAKFHATQVDVVAKALEGGKDAAQAFADHLRDVGKVEATISGSHILPVTVDVSEAMLKVGASAKTFSEAITGTDADMARFGEAVRGSGADITAQNAVLLAAKQAHEDYAAGVDKATKFNQLFVPAVDTASASLQNNASSSLEARDAAHDLGEAMKNKAEKAAADLADQMDATRRAGEQLTAQWDALKGSVSDDQAFIDVKNQFDDVKAAAQASWDAAASGAEDAEQKARDNASAVDDLKLKVIDFGKEVLGLPPEQVTKILADIDEGSLDSVERRLAILARNRTANVFIQAHGGAGFNDTGTPHFAAGGPVRAGQVAIVGEQGPELVQFGANGHVSTAAETRQILARSGDGVGGGDTTVVNNYHLTVNVDHALTERELSQMLAKMRRLGFPNAA